MKLKQNLEERLKYLLPDLVRETAKYSVSFAMGYGLGKLGQTINHEEIPAVLLVMDIIGGLNINHVVPYIFYGSGVALSYL